jgi:hypothetical protein
MGLTVLFSEKTAKILLQVLLRRKNKKTNDGLFFEVQMEPKM